MLQRNITDIYVHTKRCYDTKQIYQCSVQLLHFYSFRALDVTNKLSCDTMEVTLLSGISMRKVRLSVVETNMEYSILEKISASCEVNLDFKELPDLFVVIVEVYNGEAVLAIVYDSFSCTVLLSTLFHTKHDLGLT